MPDSAETEPGELAKTAANYAPLTPLGFMARAAQVFPDHPAVVHGNLRRTWVETYARCRRLASALTARGIGAGDTVAVMTPNTPPMFEAHYGVPRGPPEAARRPRFTPACRT